jgi:predicted HTH domain antitoxin
MRAEVKRIMSTATGTQLQDVLKLARSLTEAEKDRLADLLRYRRDELLPESASLDEAIELYLAEACGLGRAAKLAGVTRWDLMDRMRERGIPLYVVGERTAAEMDALADELRREDKP